MHSRDYLQNHQQAKNWAFTDVGNKLQIILLHTLMSGLLTEAAFELKVAAELTCCMHGTLL